MIEAWQFSLSGNSGTRSEKKSLFCEEQKRQKPGSMISGFGIESVGTMIALFTAPGPSYDGRANVGHRKSDQRRVDCAASNVMGPARFFSVSIRFSNSKAYRLLVQYSRQGMIGVPNSRS